MSSTRAASLVRVLAYASVLATLGPACDGRSRAPESASAPAPQPERPSAPAPAPVAQPTDVQPDTPQITQVVHDTPRRLLGTGAEEETVLRTLALATARRFRPVGSTAIVLKMELGATVAGAFKPRSRTHPQGWLAEIAAYRVARCLELDDVPAVITRVVRREQLRAFMDPGSAGDLPAIEGRMLWDGDSVPGAAIQWIQGLTSLGLERPDRMAEWSAWLSVSGTPAPPERAELARDLSNALVFDYLIGNFDRFSGANLGGTPDGRRLYLRDHNLAFLSPLPLEQHERLWRRLARAERFSRSLVRNLRALDAARLEAELDRDPSLRDRPRIVGQWIRDVLDRRDAVLSRVATLVDEHGASRVLVFP